MAPAGPLHAHTITCLRNSGAKYRERRDNAVLARPRRTEASSSTGNETAAVNAADKFTTRTKHLCWVREAHCVSLHDPGRISQSACFFYFQKINIGERKVVVPVVPIAFYENNHFRLASECICQMSCGFSVLRLESLRYLRFN